MRASIGFLIGVILLTGMRCSVKQAPCEPVACVKTCGQPPVSYVCTCSPGAFPEDNCPPDAGSLRDDAGDAASDVGGGS
jgi:hypothetical protein